VKRFFRIVIFIDLLFIIYSFFASRYFLLNSQLAFIASLLIVLGSFWGYKRVVQKRSHITGRDSIDEIEDRFELYEETELSRKSPREILEEEKAKIKSKRAALKHFVMGAGGFFSPFRLGGYAVLVLSVLVLIRKGLFEPASFLAGLAIVPIAALVMALLPEDQSSM